MTYLLDTNAVSEARRARPDTGFIDWLTAQSDGDMHLSVLSLGELRRGLLSLPPGDRRVALEAWLTATVRQFADRILPVDEAVAAAWAELTLAHRAKGRVVNPIDELIAATALARDLTVVTRNVRDFEASGCRLLSPWNP